MEGSEKHEVNPYIMIFIAIIISFTFIELFVFIATFYFAEDVECYWWGCKFTTTTKTIYHNMTLEDIQKLLNDSKNSSYRITSTSTTRCYFNNTWHNTSCAEVLNGNNSK